MNSYQYQQQTAKLVEDRGYRDDWTTAQYAARQVVKLAEELAELVVEYNLPISIRSVHGEYTWPEQLRHVGKIARNIFDDVDKWKGIECSPSRDALERAWSELADVQVVVYTLASVLCEMLNEDRSIGRAARNKAMDDVKRGTR